MLVEALDGEQQRAALVYEQLVRHLPTDDRVLGAAQLRLAACQYRLGHVEVAREVLLEGIRSGTCLGECHELLGRIELAEASVSEVPTVWTFDTPDHGFFHPWKYDDKGTIRIHKASGEDPHLRWHTFVDARKDDRLVVGFDQPRPAPRRISLNVRSLTVPAWLEIVVLDEKGRAHVLPGGAFAIPTDRTRTLTVDLHDLRPLVPGDPPLDPADISGLILRDVSALEGTPPGENALAIDDFEIE